MKGLRRHFVGPRPYAAWLLLGFAVLVLATDAGGGLKTWIGKGWTWVSTVGQGSA